MAQKITYVLVRLEITNPKVDEITDDEIDYIVQEVDYQFSGVGDYKIETEISGRCDENFL